MTISHSLCARRGFWGFLPWDGLEMYKVLKHTCFSFELFAMKATPARRTWIKWEKRWRNTSVLKLCTFPRCPMQNLDVKTPIFTSSWQWNLDNNSVSTLHSIHMLCRSEDVVPSKTVSTYMLFTLCLRPRAQFFPIRNDLGWWITFLSFSKAWLRKEPEW